MRVTAFGLDIERNVKVACMVALFLNHILRKLWQGFLWSLKSMEISKLIPDLEKVWKTKF